MFDKVNNYIKQYSDKNYSFITGNGTSAIYLTLKASHLPEGSKIAVPNISCPDPVYAIIWAGYEPVFIDVNMDDYNMNIESLTKTLEINKDIKGIIAIHLFGNACDIVEIKKLSKKYNCFLIEDCAQAFGNEIDAGKLGAFGDVSIFSFGNGKIVEVGHGGAVATNNTELLEKIKIEYERLPEFNEDKIKKLSKLHRNIYYKLYYLGIKFPKFNILNLIYVYFFKNYYLYKFEKNKIEKILFELDNFELNKKERIRIINFYIQNLQNKKNIKLPKLNNKENILSRFTILIESAEKISKQIRDNGVPSNTMYPILIDRFKLFFNKNKYKNSYKLKGKLLNLWTNNINTKQIKKTIDIIKGIN